MKWILYLMLFTTPAVNIKTKAEIACLAQDSVSQIASIFECRPKFEGKHIWSLQSTSQLEFSTLESCVRTQYQLIANSNVASTMTLRSWCFCDSDKAQCPTDKQAATLVGAIRNCELEPTGSRCQDARKTTNNFIAPDAGSAAGQNSSSIRLYPP
jgi:hypothetical protein